MAPPLSPSKSGRCKTPPPASRNSSRTTPRPTTSSRRSTSGFALEPKATRVASKLRIRPNPKVATGGRPLQLDGEALKLESVAIDGNTLSAGDYALTDRSLTIAQVPAHPFTLEIVTTCDPEANTELSGLYRTRGTYCTQCEPEGFRRITYFLDRPDVLARLYGAHRGGQGIDPRAALERKPGRTRRHPRHRAPLRRLARPLPQTVLSLRAGRVAISTAIRDSFVTASGREVALAHLCRARQGGPLRLGHGLAQTLHALGRGVASAANTISTCSTSSPVSDFNMGAMENKGLNIFNDKLRAGATRDGDATATTPRSRA